MGWKFWEKQQNGNSEAKGAKLPKPRDLPQQIGMYLVVNEKQEPDVVWSLKCVLRPRQERKDYFDFRVYNPFHANDVRVNVVDYNSLENHPELILFKGKYDKNAKDPELDKSPTMPRAA